MREFAIFLRNRKASRQAALDALLSAPADQLPDEVRISQELQSAQLRAVIQEQNDVIELLAAYPFKAE